VKPFGFLSNAGRAREIATVALETCELIEAV